jgi:glycosyltransferase involved in cell wall biosynthesis
VQTEEGAKKLIKKGCKRSKIKVVRSHIDTKKFRPLNKTSLKKKYGYKKIVLYYGAMRKDKGVDALMKAIPLVEEDVMFVFASRVKNYNKKYDLMVGKLGIKNKVEIITKDIDIVDYVNMADCVVLAYPNLIGTEGNPSCMIEAMACKTPVITTRLPELKEIVKEEEDVLMVEPGDIKELAKEIDRLLGDKKLQKKLAENAYRKSQEFDVKKITTYFIGLYKELLS